MLTKKAFDLKKIQRGNKALEVDRNLVEPLAKAYLERMSLDDKIEQIVTKVLLANLCF